MRRPSLHIAALLRDTVLKSHVTWHHMMHLKP